ncbi:MAG: DNA-binding transcriptional LysR family regulator [Alcanivorax sp.]|jgi:DNA-binding transcriptional LysR family regulator
MKLTLDALTVLDAIERKGSFAGAAEVLFRVPSTVTYTVQKLEDDLGFAIFKRVGRRSVLTPAGQVLLEQGRQLLVAAQDVVASAHQVSSGWEAELNIAIDTVWDMQNIYPLLAEFQQLNSGVQVNISEEVMGGTLEAIIEHRADITLGGPPPVSPVQGIQFESIINAQWLFVVAQDHSLTTAPQPLT